MAGFEERLIEDLGHEISDVIITGEELLQAQSQAEDPLQFAREFRSLLATLEMGVRLLQWDDFAAFLSGFGHKFDAAFMLNEEAESVRAKMRRSIQLLLRIHEGFDGIRFSAEQLNGWSLEIEMIWELGIETTVAAPEPQPTIPIEPPVSEIMASEAFAAVKGVSKHVDAYAFVVELWGQEFLFPIDQVVGVVRYSPGEFLEHTPAPHTVEFKGIQYPISQLKDFRNSRPSAGVDRLDLANDFIFFHGKNHAEALRVDRLIGIQKLDSPSAAGPTKLSFLKMEKKSHLAPRWLYVA